MLINILPSDEKKLIRKEYRLRLSSICLFFLATLFVIATFLLVPLYVSSQYKLDALTKNLNSLDKNNIDTSLADYKKLVLDVNSTLAILEKGQTSRSAPADMIERIVVSRPKGIRFSQIVYTVVSPEVSTLRINGTASDRASLRALETTLESDPQVKKVILPVSSFTKRTDIGFNIILNL